MYIGSVIKMSSICFSATLPELKLEHKWKRCAESKRIFPELKLE